MMILETRRASFPRLIFGLRFLRAERLRLVSLSKTADRAMRTRIARSMAHAIHTFTLDWMNGARPADGRQTLLAALAKRVGWTRRSDRELVMAFGGRRSVIAVPPGIDVPQFISLVTRTEVGVLLGDCDWGILKELQSLASRELQYLAEQDSTTSGA